MHFGFSYVSFIFLLMLMIPNIAWTKNKPRDYEKYAVRESRVLLALERVGQVSVSCAALFFSGHDLRLRSARSRWLVAALLTMALYETFWIRYFRSERSMRDFYAGLLGIPVAGATLPVSAFMLLAVYEKNVALAISVMVLGIGHIGIHLMHRKAIS